MYPFSERKQIALFLAVAALLICGQLRAQLTVTTAPTPTIMVQSVLLGGGVTASGITYSGNANSRGTFNGALSNIGFASGVILTTGNLNNAVGPNNLTGASQINSLPGDPDLDIIMSPVASFDVSILEFDFVATSDTLKFNYVFGSEEYMEYVSSTPGGINDGFGFFISGPGISGPFSGGAENIAIIPGTSLPVTMFNLNLNVNSAYYFDNGNGMGTGTAPDGSTIQYDGFTVPLTATAFLQCGQTYHIKLAIADGGDNSFDSGVFIEEGSFVSTGNIFMIPSANFGGAPSGNDTIMYEGCGSASILFDRGIGDLAVADTLYFTLSGTALNGTDFAMVSDSVFFPVGQDTASVLFNSLADALVEGTETIVVTAFVSTSCGNDTASVTFLIIDSPTFTVSLNNDTTLYCPMTSIPLTAVVSGGVPIGGYSYSWTNTSSATSVATVNPSVTTTYIVTVTDSCGHSATDNITVTVAYAPLQLNLNNDTSICSGETVFLDATPSAGAPDYTYSWSPAISFVDTATVGPTATSSYTLVVTDNCGLTVSDTVTVTVYPLHADFSESFVTNQNVQFEDQSTGGVSYFWNFGDASEDSVSTQQNPLHLYINDGTYTVMLVTTNVQGCKDTTWQVLNVLPDFYFYFPNAFSPNANGRNDVFKGYGAGIKKYSMRVYDRWGELIFMTNDLEQGWDGTFKGKKAPSAVYAVIFDVEGYHEEIKRYLSSITLVK